MSWLRGRTMMLLVVVLLLLSAGGTGLAEPGGWDHRLRRQMARMRRTSSESCPARHAHSRRGRRLSGGTTRFGSVVICESPVYVFHSSLLIGMGGGYHKGYSARN